MAGATSPAPDPVVLGYERISGGNWRVTYSVGPARRRSVVIPVESFNEGAIALHGRRLAAEVTPTKGT